LETTGENYRAVRVGFCMVRGLTKKDVERIVAVRETRRYASIEDLWRRANVPVALSDLLLNHFTGTLRMLPDTPVEVSAG
jgi:DNA polymerase III alpha subunit